MGNGKAVGRLDTVFGLQYAVDGRFVYFSHVHALSTAQNSRQNHFRSFRYEQEDGFLRWLFEQFQ